MRWAGCLAPAGAALPLWLPLLLAAAAGCCRGSSLSLQPRSLTCTLLSGGGGDSASAADERQCSCIPWHCGERKHGGRPSPCIDHLGGVGLQLNCSSRGFQSIQSGLRLRHNVKHLDLSVNSLQTLEDTLFGGVRVLEALVLRENKLINVSDAALLGLHSLKILDLSHNELTELPEKLFQDQADLRVLNVSFNYISSLPPEIFANVSKLHTLSLSDNAAIGSYLEESPEAVMVVLRRGLKRLEINNVNLAHIPVHLLDGADRLEALLAADNAFTSVPGLWAASLRSLDLSGANISALQPGAFLALPRLEALHLSRLRCLLAVGEGALAGLPRLRVLSMDACPRLQEFHELALGPADSPPPKLRSFSVAHCGLHTLAERLLAALRSAPVVRLHGNPWHCDCRLAWLKQLNLSREESALLRCERPAALRHLRLSALRPSQLRCGGGGRRAGLLVGLAATLAVVLTAVLAALLVAAYGALHRRCCRPYLRLRARPVTYRPVEQSPPLSLDPNRAEGYWEEAAEPPRCSLSVIRR